MHGENICDRSDIMKDNVVLSSKQRNRKIINEEYIDDKLRLQICKLLKKPQNLVAVKGKEFKMHKPTLMIATKKCSVTLPYVQNVSAIIKYRTN